MVSLCRFCLMVSDQEMCKLREECDILSKIRSSLCVHITIEDSFPNQLCKECVEKIIEIDKFCSKVKENEQKLQQCFNNGSLQDYYLQLINNIDIKEEKNSCLFFSKSKYVKNEDLNTNRVFDAEIISDQTESNLNKKLSQCESIKNEETTDNDTNEVTFTSEEEITLLSLKNDNLEDSNLKSHSKPKRRKQKALPYKKTKINEQSETQNIANVNSDSVKQFTCLTCLELCDSQLNLIKHYHTEHMKLKNTTKPTYTVNKDGDFTYKCDNCEKICDNKKDIVKHIGSHNDDRPLICKLCGRMYKTVTEIIRHSRVHSGFKLQCSHKCGYTTAYQGALKEHENRHLDVYKYKCEKCGKGFHVRTWFEQHQNIHDGLKPFSCDLCGLTFHMARYLTAHKTLVHPQTSSVKRYICVHCNHKCDSANSLALHLEEHGINKEKEFLCDFCGKILSSGDQLKYHHRMHSGVKPYSCSICNKTFAKKFNVKVHMSSHSSEKTHACAGCGKRYTQRSTLLRHLRRHHPGTSPIQPG